MLFQGVPGWKSTDVDSCAAFSLPTRSVVPWPHCPLSLYPATSTNPFSLNTQVCSLPAHTCFNRCPPNPWTLQGCLRLEVTSKKRVSSDPTRNCIYTSNKNTKIHGRRHSNRQSYTTMYFHIRIGTGSYTTSTTNMYPQEFTYNVANGNRRRMVVARPFSFGLPMPPGFPCVKSKLPCSNRTINSNGKRNGGLVWMFVWRLLNLLVAP